MAGTLEHVDSIFAGNITITNSSGAAIKDVVLDCEGFGSSGAMIGHTRTTLHGTVHPHRTDARANVPLPFLQRNVTSASCTVWSFATDPSRPIP